MKLTLTTLPIVEEIANGDDFRPTLSGTWTGTNLGSAQVYLQATDSAGTFVMPAVALAPAGNNYSYTVPLAGTVGVGSYNGLFTVRACQDIQCIKPYTGAMQTVSYSLKVNAVAEWETLQRNAAHDGYVPIRLDPAKFTKAWEWQRPTPGVLSFINSVVTFDGKVFVSEDEYAGKPWLYALSEQNGAIAWKQQFDLSPSPALNPPAVSDGKVYVTTTGHGSTYLWAFNAADGSPVIQSQFATQWANLLAPTVKNGRVFVNGGYYGGVVYAYNATTGTPLWSKSSGTYGMNTPAVDDAHVYSYNGTSLDVHNVASGDIVATIGGTSGGIQTDYHGTPMLGSPDHVIAYRGGAFSGRASSSTEPYESRYLVNYSVANKAVRWTSAKTYKTYPAVAKGVIYVASNNPKSFDAIDEATGQVLWSWVPGTMDTTFHRNVIVTNNLVLVSTNRAVYALDLATRKPVWESPTPGALAISATRMLYIATGTRESNGKLVAFRLR